MEKHRTKSGLVMKIYNGQRSSSKRRGHSMPSYTLDELRTWAFAQKRFNVLYNNWVSVGYTKMDRPSVDRKDDSLPYTISNIRLTTWKRNRAKQSKDIRSGKLKHRQKKVSQYTKDNVFIKEYISISEASRETKTTTSNICSVLSGRRKTTGGFIWR